MILDGDSWSSVSDMTSFSTVISSSSASAPASSMLGLSRVSASKPSVFRNLSRVFWTGLAADPAAAFPGG